MNIVTNNVPRSVIDAYELTADERREFDYIDWQKIDRGEDSASFIRYRGELYDLSEFERWDAPLSWDALRPYSHYTGLVVRYCDDPDYIIVGRYYT